MARSPLQNPVQAPSPHGASPAVNPLSLSVEEMARMLSAGGGKRVSAQQVQADIDGGAPIGPDGRLNLVQYAAWLVRQVQSK